MRFSGKSNINKNSYAEIYVNYKYINLQSWVSTNKKIKIITNKVIILYKYIYTKILYSIVWN